MIPLTNSQARFFAKGRNGSAQVQYHGFCVGASSQNHARVRNDPRTNAVNWSLDEPGSRETLLAIHAAINKKIVTVIPRAIANGDATSASDIRQRSGKTVNHGRAWGPRPSSGRKFSTVIRNRKSFISQRLTNVLRPSLGSLADVPW